MRRFEIVRYCEKWCGRIIVKWAYHELQRVFNDGLSVKNFVPGLVFSPNDPESGKDRYGYKSIWKIYKRRTFNEVWAMGNCRCIPTYFFEKNISSVLRNTPFKYAKKGKDPGYYAFWIKPIELFEKVGMNDMAHYLELGCRQGINIKATNLYSAMKISKKYRDIVCNKSFDGHDLIITQKLIRAGIQNITKDDIEIMGRALNYYSEKKWRDSGFSIPELLTATHYTTDYSMYFDYIGFCKDLGYDITDPYIRFPKNLRAAHDREMKRVKAVSSQIFEKKISDRFDPDYEQFYFSDGLFFIRPPQTLQELTAEGAGLHHCVGTYANRVADKTTTILFVRTIKSPETPFYTVEWRGAIMQCRGKGNSTKTQEISDFLEAWEKNIKNRKNSRSKKNKPEMAMAVAV